MKYNYDSLWAGQNPIRTDVRTIANKLLSSLKAIREVSNAFSDSRNAFVALLIGSTNVGMSEEAPDLHRSLLWRPSCATSKSVLLEIFDPG